MMKVEYSAHRSTILAMREAVSLYLLQKNRQEDMSKIAEVFLSVDNYKGDRVPISVALKEINYICNTLHDNHIGLKLYSLIDIDSLPFCKAISECISPFSSTNNTLPFLLVSRLIFRFFFLITEAVDLKLVPEKGSLRFDLIPNDSSLMSKHQIDGIMVTVHRMVERFCPGILKKVYVAQRHSEYELAYYKSIFGVPVSSAARTSLVYDLKCKDHYKDAAKLLMQSEEEVGRSFYINPLFNMLSNQFSGLSYKDRCEIVIDTMIGVSPSTRSHVANSMNISVSTLQRRLNEEGYSFQEVLEETRKRLAKMYLNEKNISIIDVAYLLGYKSHSQFFKVFKTWFGMTPKTYQKSITNCMEFDVGP